MSEPLSTRRVTIRPLYSDYYVPAVPDDVLRLVFGSRRVDPNVELVVLIFEFWLRSTPSQIMIRRQMLEAMPGRITPHNVYDFISLLAKRKVAAQFFDLTRTGLDTDGALRDFIFRQGVTIDTIRLYASFSGISPKDFIDGFAIGVAESFATVVVDLLNLLKLLERARMEFLHSLVLAAFDAEAGATRLFAQATAIGQAMQALVKQLDPTRIPGHIVQVWNTWNADFARHLENLDARSAGRVLGRIAGDLWQLLTGFIALGKLLKVGAAAAVRYAPVLVGSLRKAAAQAGALLRELAALLKQIGVVAIEKLPKVGMGVLTTLFPPEIFEALIRHGRAVVTHLEDTILIACPQPAFAMAGSGASLGRPYAVVMMHENRAVMMATVTETLPSRAAGAAAAAVDDLDVALDALWGKHLKPYVPGRPLSVVEAEVKAARVALLRQRLDLRLRQLLQRTTYDEFRRLKKSGKFYPKDLGRDVHRQMDAKVAALLSEAAPGTTAFSEKSFTELAKQLFATRPGELTGRLKQLLDEPVHRFLRRHPDILDLIGADARRAASESDAAFIAYLRERFKWKTAETPRIGQLKSDLIVVDHEMATVTNVDWTASTNLDRFEKLWGQVVDDLGGKFDGDWDRLAEAYRKAHKRDVPAAVARELDELTWHAVRETVIRQRVLEELFPLFNVSSHELLYSGMAKLFRLIREP